MIMDPNVHEFSFVTELFPLDRRDRRGQRRRLGADNLAQDQARLSARKRLGPGDPPEDRPRIDRTDQAADQRECPASRRTRFGQGPAGNVERIVTDQPSKLAREIDALATRQGRTCMMGPPEVFIALIVVGLPVLLLMLIANRFFKLRRSSWRSKRRWRRRRRRNMRRASTSLSSACGCWSRSSPISGAETAAQIEALRRAADRQGGRVGRSRRLTQCRNRLNRRTERGIAMEDPCKLDLGLDPSGGDRDRPVQDVAEDQGKADRGAERASPPRRARNMQRTSSGSRHALRVLEQIVTDRRRRDGRANRGASRTGRGSKVGDKIQ